MRQNIILGDFKMKATKNSVTETIKKEVQTNLQDLTKEELKHRAIANVAERKRLAEENKVIWSLYQNAVSTTKKSAMEKRIAELQAKLEALQESQKSVK
jgi:dsRNA-specific ribonuclease